MKLYYATGACSLADRIALHEAGLAGFKPFLHAVREEDRAKAANHTSKRLDLIARTLGGPYLLGARFTVADAYLFVVLTLARKLGLRIPPALTQYFQRVMARESVRRALAEEGLSQEQAVLSEASA